MPDLELLVAAELYGEKHNIKFLFPTRPTLKEFTRQVELAFQKESVCLSQGRPVHKFEVSNIQVYHDEISAWQDVVRQTQLVRGMQYYAFQLRGPVGLKARCRSESVGSRNNNSNISCKTPKKEVFRGGRRRSSSSASQRRSTSITDRQSHYRDERARITPEIQAEKTLMNDKRYNIFIELAPNGRFCVNDVKQILLLRGVSHNAATHLESSMKGMEKGINGTSSYAQYCRFFRKNPRLADMLYNCLITPPEPQPAPQPTLIHPTEIKPEPDFINSPNTYSLSEDDTQKTKKINNNTPSSSTWLDFELSKLEEEHREKVRRVKQAYLKMQDQQHFNQQVITPRHLCYMSTPTRSVGYPTPECVSPDSYVDSVNKQDYVDRFRRM